MISCSIAQCNLYTLIKAQCTLHLLQHWQQLMCLRSACTIRISLPCIPQVHRGSSVVPGIDGPRCKFTYKQSSFLLKWAVQLANHIGQSSFFVWPLITHMRLMEQSKLIGVVSSAGDELYRRLARRGIIAMLVSVVFEGECSTGGLCSEGSPYSDISLHPTC
jgi:hypothetical protein